MRRRFLVAFLALTAVLLLALEVPLGLAYAHDEEQRGREDVRSDALALAAIAEAAAPAGAAVGAAASAPAERLDLGAVADRFRREDPSENAAVYDAHMQLVGDLAHTEPEGRDSELHAVARRALTGPPRGETGRLDDEGDGLLYAATPVLSGTTPVGVIVVTADGAAVKQRTARRWALLATIAAIALAVSAAVAWWLTTWVTRPLRQLQAAADRLGHGDLATRVAEQGPPELADVGRTFNRMADQLQQLLDAQQAFVADASHQLATPLTALRLRLENLERDDPRSMGDDLRAASEEAQRLSRLVDGLLALARAERRTDDLEPIDVGAVVLDRTEAWQALAEESDVDLQPLVASDEPLLASAVRGATEQILDNLIANALDASTAGGSIHVRATCGELIEVHVIDHGRGMTADERRHAFDRFWQSADATQGSGLGLSIVRQLVSASGGDVELQPVPGGGVDARVRLQRA